MSSSAGKIKRGSRKGFPAAWARAKSRSASLGLRYASGNSLRIKELMVVSMKTWLGIVKNGDLQQEVDSAGQRIRSAHTPVGTRPDRPESSETPPKGPQGDRPSTQKQTRTPIQSMNRHGIPPIWGLLIPFWHLAPPNSLVSVGVLGEPRPALRALCARDAPPTGLRSLCTKENPVSKMDAKRGGERGPGRVQDGPGVSRGNRAWGWARVTLGTVRVGP